MSKLWELTDPTFRLRQHGGSGPSSFLSAGKIAAVYWPSGLSCWPVNAYLIALLRANSAPSSVATYAAQLSHLVRFVAKLNIEFEQLTDDRLLELAGWLRERPSSKTSSRQVNRIILRVIDFLLWFQQRLVLERPIIGEDGDGAAITIEFKSTRVRGRLVQRRSHPAVGPPNVARVVRPISSNNIATLMAQASSMPTSSFVRARDLAMLKLLMDSGIRRQELVWVTVAALRAARENGGRLDIRSAKRRGNPTRQVVVPLDTIAAVNRFIDIQRALLFDRRRTLKRGSDDAGWAFCSVSGEQLAPVTVTQTIGRLRRSAGIKERATAHMFRHRWITLQVAKRLDSVRSDVPLGLDALTTILSRLASMTGHSSINSLWTYVDWAFDEIERASSATQTPGGEIVAALEELASELKRQGVQDETLRALNRIRMKLSPHATGPTKMSVSAHSMRETGGTLARS